MDRVSFEAAVGLMDAVAAGVFAVTVAADGVRLTFANKLALAVRPDMTVAVPTEIAERLRTAVATDTIGPCQVALDDGWIADLAPVGNGQWIGTLVEAPPPLAEAEALLGAIFRIADIGMCVTAEDRTFALVNDAYTRLYDWPREALVGRPFTMVLPEADREAAADLHDRYIRGETDESPGEWRVQGRNGRIIPVLVTASRMILPDGRRFKVTTVTDITALKDREAELIAIGKRAEDLERVKTNFLGHMSHELRTPLNGIIGFTDMIRSEIHGPVAQPAYRDYLEAIHSSGSLLLSLVNDVLEIARSDVVSTGGPERLDREPLDLVREASMVLFMISPEARKRGIELLLQGRPAMDGGYTAAGGEPSGEIVFWGRSRSIRQILLNLIGNAIKFSPPRGTVEVSVTHEGDRLRIAVKDAGPGLTADQIARLGEPFYRTVRAQREAVPGTGLGLAVSKRLAEADGGELAFHSPPEGGTVASLLLPATADTG